MEKQELMGLLHWRQVHQERHPISCKSKSEITQVKRSELYKQLNICKGKRVEELMKNTKNAKNKSQLRSSEDSHSWREN